MGGLGQIDCHTAHANNVTYLQLGPALLGQEHPARREKTLKINEWNKNRTEQTKSSHRKPVAMFLCRRFCDAI